MLNEWTHWVNRLTNSTCQVSGDCESQYISPHIIPVYRKAHEIVFVAFPPFNQIYTSCIGFQGSTNQQFTINQLTIYYENTLMSAPGLHDVANILFASWHSYLLVTYILRFFKDAGYMRIWCISTAREPHNTCDIILI